MAGKVGFIGLGAMGGPMALNLVKAGFKLVVHDIDQTKTAPLRAKGAELAGTAEAVAAEVERTIVIVETTDQAQAVIAGERGIIKGAKPGHIVLCMATIDPFAARTLADQLAAQGIAMLDAPVSGGMPMKAPNQAVAAGRFTNAKMPATTTQPRKKSLRSRRSVQSAHASPAARNPL